MDIVDEAKAILMKDCIFCKYYSRMDDGVELCRKRKFNNITGHGAASMKKKYGVAALPIYIERTCNHWENFFIGGNK